MSSTAPSMPARWFGETAALRDDFERACAHAEVIAQDLKWRTLATGIEVTELKAESLAAWVECRQSWDPQRGAQLTHAWPRMFGRPRDLLRSEERLQHRRVHMTTDQSPLQPEVTPSVRLALYRAIDRETPEMTTLEIAVLQHSHVEGDSLRQVAQQLGRTDDAVQRAHHRLLRRLRRALEEPAS